jgi:phosphoribosylformimino-5-aminoimidazole carboxamide ribotide isomerase
MAMFEPIPSIDTIGGQCVRLTKGDYATKTIYPQDPISFAVQVERLGFKRIHIVDLDGAKSSHVVNLDILKQVTSKTKLLVDFGGGIKSDEDIQAVFDNGARWATIGSIAVKKPDIFERWITQYGADHIILGADVKNERICINGWKEESPVDLFDFIGHYINKGIEQILCTDISKDGMLQGTALPLYTKILSAYPQCHLIASGGVSCLDDLKDLDRAGVPAAVFGKAIYEGHISLSDVAASFNLT